MRTMPTLMLSLVLATPAVAADGVLEINQTCALQGGCFAGDAAGFPVTITTTGSYRLTGNLTIPDETTTAIVVSASGSTLDLGGFEIHGPNTCAGSPLTCTLTGTGFGVQLTGSRVRILNGAVTGVGGVGIYGPATPTTGEGHVVEDVRVSNNRFEGIRLDGDGTHVRQVTAISNGGIGVRLEGVGSVVAESVITKNALTGVLLGSLCTAQGNQIISNGQLGLWSLGTGTIFRDNSIAGNLTGAVVGGVVNAGGNVCSPGNCP